jgi:hypothetical protein
MLPRHLGGYPWTVKLRISQRDHKGLQMAKEKLTSVLYCDNRATIDRSAAFVESKQRYSFFKLLGAREKDVYLDNQKR